MGTGAGGQPYPIEPKPFLTILLTEPFSGLTDPCYPIPGLGQVVG